MTFPKHFLFIFVVIFSQALWGQDDYGFNSKIQVIQKGKEIFIQGNDCQLLKKEADALMAWTQKVKEKAKKEKCSCSEGVCLQKVTAQIPAFAKDKQFKKSKNDGPNCWNATLVASKIVPQVRYTSQNEMNFWMSSPLCREKNTGEPLSPGDVVAIRNGDDGEVHGFIHLSDNLSFSKNGYDRSMAYSLQDPDFVFDTYEVPKECRRKVGEPEECHIWANYFTCQSMDDYLEKHPIKDKNLKTMIKQINEIECNISEMAFDGSLSEVKMLQEMVIEAVKELARGTLEKGEYAPEEKVIWQGIYFKCEALQDQISIGRNIN